MVGPAVVAQPPAGQQAEGVAIDLQDRASRSILAGVRHGVVSSPTSRPLVGIMGAS
jgi:hypothetical protein